MRMHIRAAWAAAALLFAAVLVGAFAWRGVRAADDSPPGPDRYEIVTQSYLAHEWWLTGWRDNRVACELRIDHAGLPTGGEIYAVCGSELYEEWIDTPPCPEAAAERGTCTGYYLVFIRSEPAERQAGVALPAPVVWIALDGCAPYRSTLRCEDMPTLVLSGEEPLPGETITGLAGSLDGRPFTCDPVCQVDLGPTDTDGLLIRFWAYSSYGDSSPAYEARLRIASLDDPEDPYWYVDVLSDRWRGAPLPGCALTWEAFPPLGGSLGWLSTPDRPEDLATDIPYEYLASRLIGNGLADVSACPDGGLDEAGGASPCGLEASRPAVTDWQNRFDDLILAAARETGIPAQLLKNIFSRESQFWPGVSEGQAEAGLGQMTENGADTTLLWNPSFYEQFCPTVLDDALCQRGYPQLQEPQQLSLRRALVESVDAFCVDCPLGIDLDRAEASVAIFAETLLANCAQAGVIVRNTYERAPGDLATYADLWRFSLVNYNAGPGCLTLAIREVDRLGEPLDWEHLSAHLTPACLGALDYVTDIGPDGP